MKRSIGLSAVMVVLAGALASLIGQASGPEISAPALLCNSYSGLPDERSENGRHGMVQVPAGTFTYGSTRFYEEEGPPVKVQVSRFWIDVHPVTNAQFARFATQTGYVTDAERGIDTETDPSLPSKLRQPGAMVFVQGPDVLRPGWQFVSGANWRHPQGPESDWQMIKNHPVVQVTLKDAQAYAHWAGHKLPSEAQLEYAMRGGLEDADYSWGRTELIQGKPMANTWQGQFPYHNAAVDGFTGTSPVGCFLANGFGLFDAGGNVWELTRSGYRPQHNPRLDAIVDPPGPLLKDSFDPAQPGTPVTTIKGGSHLCSADLCMRYRPSARQPQTWYLATSHVGFRTVSSSL